MRLLTILFSCLILTCFACSQNQDINAVFTDCATLADTQILPEAEKSTTCIYFEVYRYRTAIYMLCNCCVCDKAPMAINCAGASLCDLSENCMIDFYAEADYLFSVTDD